MPNNMILLETIALTQSAASVTFDNLPTSGYTDLKIVASARTDNTGAGYRIKASFNGSSSNFTGRFLYGGGSGSGASSTTTNEIFGFVDGTTETASTFSNNEIYIPNYLSTTAAKSVSTDTVMENNATQAYAALWAGLWNPGTQAAINSVTLTAELGNFVANSTFSLYGIAALGTTPAIAPKATGGNRIENDGTYWIHTFTSSGNFVPQTGLTCEYLVVAGGGGGSATRGGGGGAGGLRSTVGATGGGGSLETPLSLTTIPYAITVGAGGAGDTWGANSNASGSNSVFSTVTSTGGGKGGYSQSNGTAGGSGGGSGNEAVNNGQRTGGAASPAGQGYPGGQHSAPAGRPDLNCGGGGGAGATGGNGTWDGTSGVGGVGGAGVTTSISGLSVTYAAGGGGTGGTTGGLGGSGIGGNGGATGSGTSGLVNTGSGGGGGAYNSPSTSGNGASGIVIVRYPIN